MTEESRAYNSLQVTIKLKLEHLPPGIYEVAPVRLTWSKVLTSTTVKGQLGCSGHCVAGAEAGDAFLF